VKKPEGQKKTTRKRPSFSGEQLYYARLLLKAGTHGDNLNQVLKSLVNHGVQKAFRDHIIRPDERFEPGNDAHMALANQTDSEEADDN
jgi:hypothetical protein